MKYLLLILFCLRMPALRRQPHPNKQWFKNINSLFIDRGFDFSHKNNPGNYRLTKITFIIHPLRILIVSPSAVLSGYCQSYDISEEIFDQNVIFSFINQCKNPPCKRSNDIPLSGLILSRGIIMEYFNRIVELPFPINSHPASSLTGFLECLRRRIASLMISSA